MTQNAVIPDVALTVNTSQRLPCVLVLDGSSSMAAGGAIAELNEGLSILEKELKADPIASQRVQLLVIRLGGNDQVEVLVNWTDAMDFTAPTIVANGSTPLGAAVRVALSHLDEQKDRYKTNGIAYNRPWVFALTDGEPTDRDWESAARECKAAEEQQKLVFFGVGVGQANLKLLGQFSSRPPARLQGLKFKELFVWLSRSASSASKAAQGSNAQLASPGDWMAAPT
jgi:uncharacterized protein YegL